MITFPNSKINLGLHITRKRPDGYHDIETVFYPIHLNDAFEIAETNDVLEFTATGIEVPVDDSNLSLKAYKLLKKDFPDIPPVKMHLHKAIPTGAGLGGGSSDGAYALTLFNTAFHLNLTQRKLFDYAYQLGSDCPFFILNKPALAKGRGEILKELNIDLKGHILILINPRISISTKWAFSQITPNPVIHELQNIIYRPLEEWKEFLINEFEEPIFQKYPEIGQIKTTLYNNGAIYASMSGSGSTVFGIFKEDTFDISLIDSNFFIRKIML